MVNNPISKSETALINEAVVNAEKKTNAEIKVVIFDKSTPFIFRLLPIERRVHLMATKAFNKHKLQKTKNRNAVLLYFALQERQIEILADINAYAVLGQQSLDNLVLEITSLFKAQGVSAVAIVKAIDAVAEKLKDNYPAIDKKTNGLPDETIFE